MSARVQRDTIIDASMHALRQRGETADGAFHSEAARPVASCGYRRYRNRASENRQAITDKSQSQSQSPKAERQPTTAERSRDSLRVTASAQELRRLRYRACARRSTNAMSVARDELRFCRLELVIGEPDGVAKHDKLVQG